MHTSPSSHAVGQAPAPPLMPVSQVSPALAVTTPSPQRAGQSSSVPIVAPEGQQPSPSAGAVIGG